jgi:pimeloyl-ACP methyl ester carboxylesterase
MIRDSLLPHIPNLEYHEWQPCGHYPWLEAAVHEEFFALLRDWLARHAS